VAHGLADLPKSGKVLKKSLEEFCIHINIH